MLTARTARLALLVALTIIGALLAFPVPWSAAPLTLQLAFVLMAGSLLGPVDGPLALTVYLGLGLAGLPVFAGLRAGPGILFGPTGGYLLGFVPAAAWVGRWAGPRRRPGTTRLALAMATAVLLVYALGTLQMALVLDLPLGQAAAAGIAPFVFLDGVKIVLAVAVTHRLRRSGII